MKKAIVATGAAAWLALTVAVGVVPPPEISTYVAVDADNDGRISVGDTIGWFVDEPGAVTLRCWASDEQGSPLVARYVSPPFNPKARHQGTGKSYVLLASGYCESTGAGGGVHWFLVEP